MLCLCGNTAYSAEANCVQSISFGNIIADPAGETIEINAYAGPAAPVVLTSGNTIVKGGFSGIIRIYSDIPGQAITLYYPASVAMKASGAGDMTLDGIDARSRTFATSTATGNIDFDVGGLLHIGRGQEGRNYSATMTVTVDIINP